MGIGILTVFVISLIYKGRHKLQTRGEIVINKIRTHINKKFF